MISPGNLPYRQKSHWKFQQIVCLRSWSTQHPAVICLIFSMAANERRKELGVIRALGATRRFVFQSLLLEASLLAIVGGATGIGLSALSIYLFRKLLIVSLGFPFLLPSAPVLLLQIGAGLLLALFSVNLAALFPALKFSRQDPA